MLLDKVRIDTDACKRKLYVGMTRAKRGLHIFYNNKEFDRFITEMVRTRADDMLYEKPEEILMQLSHKDVNLGFFKNKKEMIRHMICGAALLVKEGELCAEYNGKMQPVVQFSKEFRKQAEQYQAQGYVMKSARVRFVVGWMDVNEGKEYPIVLPDVCFCR